MTFDEIIQSEHLQQAQTQMTFPASWCQGRTAFGGLSAAIAVQSMKHQLTEPRRLLSVSVNFVGPLLEGAPFTVATTILRSGKNATQMQTQLIQSGEVCLIAIGCFGKDRASAIQVANADSPTLSGVNPKAVLPYQEGVMPAFFQHVALNAQQGALPFSGAPSSNLGGWMRFKSQTTSVNELHTLALADSWPPTLLQMCKAPSPASSMSWYIEFLCEISLDSESWLGFEAVTHHSQNGYGIEDAKIWSQNGKLLALSRQTVAVFD
ncbi:acyl-CoA thioesterase [Pseudoalteromonas sp. GCY]|uniref:thioesterase family protein n=1 Tax=Pseudoalteromonas sp. GCY TaxID=2003316 RepID=UPI000BFECCCD|nr:thioesterase family protein [Pseudoalteromonas sp. GCY]PHI39081.1 acyl-CoA thioesterase [Pseudoalteromonas sp. GCY]QQQ65194.1 thioesterase family protein [Pseudoalteromonas sp. GCY]